MASQFGLDLRRVCEGMKDKTETVVRAGALYMLSEMTERAPVDTGRLKGNFQVGVARINYSTSAPAGSDPVSRGAQALAAWRPGDTIYLSNSLPYALVAEYGLYGKPPGSANGPKTRAGFSSQAVGGFMRLSAQNWAEHIAQAARRPR